MVDRYCFDQVELISSKASVPELVINREDDRLGGDQLKNGGLELEVAIPSVEGFSTTLLLQRIRQPVWLKESKAEFLMFV